MMEQLQGLNHKDQDVEEIIYYSKFAVAYVLEQEGANPGWRKANIEGPVLLLRRSSVPKLQLLVKNQFSTNDLSDALHEKWELDCQKNYVFYKVESSKEKIRGLWFHDDAERQRCEAALEKTLKELRSKGPPKQAYAPGPQVEPPKAPNPQTDSLFSQFGVGKGLDVAPGGRPALAEAPAGNPGREGGALDQFKVDDPSIEGIVYSAKFAVAYFLQQEGQSPGWRKANIEGPVYLLRRSAAPKYKLIVKNQFSNNDLVDCVHPEWELDCQKNYVFYKVENNSEKIRGLWFHDDAERQKCESQLEGVLADIRKSPAPQAEALAAEAPQTDSLYAAQFGLGKLGAPPSAPPPPGSVTISPEALATSFHQLADDERFVSMIMNELRKVSVA